MPRRSVLEIVGTSYLAFLVATPLLLTYHDIGTLVTVASATATVGLLAAAAVLLARRGDGPVAWLGRHPTGQILLWLPAVFLVVPLGAFASTGRLVDPIFILLWFGLLGTGVAIGHLAQRQYYRRTCAGDPLLTCEWSPRDGAGPLVRLASLLGALVAVVIIGGHALNGHWGQTAVWIALLAGTAAGAVGQGVGQPYGLGSQSRVELYDSALVLRRPFDTTVTPWADIDHVRGRDGELVLDRGGLIDPTVEGLADADRERLFETIERHDLARILAP